MTQWRTVRHAREWSVELAGGRILLVLLCEKPGEFHANTLRALDMPRVKLGASTLTEAKAEARLKVREELHSLLSKLK
jgi:hypothetical protein